VASYNRMAGQSLERIAALSDGVFAIAMTLLVLDLHVSDLAGVHSEEALWRSLGALLPRFIPYIMSFLTLGIFWVGQQTQLNLFSRSDRNLAWIHIAFLFSTTLMPFSTALLAQFITYRAALIVYWLNVGLSGLTLYASWRYAVRVGLVMEDVPERLRSAVERRIVVAQALYALGAALCAINTYWSIAFIVLVQLNFVFAPRIPGLSKI